ncbi:MAG: exodeoxyribonuclease VII small subunit [Anaerolineaceae bacterium]|nr:exodeoxyribonuclease VII small subunit [Anaerolineaceae bacterium]
MTETTAVENLTFEQAFSELETIVSKLENDNLSLEESLAYYERGQALSQYCAGLLEKAELRLQEVRLSSQKTEE